jgi:oligo-1,6-glucosidase
VNPNYTTINAAAQEKDPNSCLNYFRSLLKLRAANIPVLIYGTYTLLDKNNPHVYAYVRENSGEKLLVLLNFSASKAQAVLPRVTGRPELLLSNYKQPPQFDKTSSKITLKAYEAAVFKL